MIGLRPALALVTTLASVVAAQGAGDQEIPPPVAVVRPDNVPSAQFRADQSVVTDRPIYISASIEVSDDAGSFRQSHGKHDASCIYQTPTAEYINIAIDVAEELGGDGVMSINAMAVNKPAARAVQTAA